LELPNGNWIPLLTAGTTIFYYSRVPTQTERQDCRRVYLKYDDEWNPARVSLQVARLLEEEEEMRWLSSLSVSAIQQGVVRKYTVASVGSNERMGRTASAVISGQDRFLGKPDPIALSISDAFDYRTLAGRLIASVQIASSDRTVASVDSGDALGAKAFLLLDRTPRSVRRSCRGTDPGLI